MVDNVMKGFFTICTILFLTVGTAWYIYVICGDISRPETWDEWQHDPRIFLPCLAVGLPLCFLVWWRQVQKLRRMEKDSRK